jgi:hypothetical protein
MKKYELIADRMLHLLQYNCSNSHQETAGCSVYAGSTSLMGDFLLGFLSCAVLSISLVSLYIKHKKREEERLRQTVAVEILRNLNVSKLRKLLGNVRAHLLFSPPSQYATDLMNRTCCGS